MGIQAVKLDTDGVATVIDLGDDNGRAFREHIGCTWFDVVRLAPDLDMWVDDEGAIFADPVMNPVASALAASAGFGPVIFGTVVLTGGADAEGDTVGIGEAWRDRVLAASAVWQSAVPAGV